jgi:hypothetical protein
MSSRSPSGSEEIGRVVGTTRSSFDVIVLPGLVRIKRN